MRSYSSLLTGGTSCGAWIDCALASSSSFSVALCSLKRSSPSSFSGNVTRLFGGFWCVSGVQTPWIDGISVCHCLRYRIDEVSPFCNRLRFIHFSISSQVLLWADIHKRSPLTENREFMNLSSAKSMRAYDTLPQEQDCDAVSASHTQQHRDWILQNQPIDSRWNLACLAIRRDSCRTWSWCAGAGWCNDLIHSAGELWWSPILGINLS